MATMPKLKLTVEDVARFDAAEVRKRLHCGPDQARWSAALPDRHKPAGDLLLASTTGGLHLFGANPDSPLLNNRDFGPLPAKLAARLVTEAVEMRYGDIDATASAIRAARPTACTPEHQPVLFRLATQSNRCLSALTRRHVLALEAAVTKQDAEVQYRQAKNRLELQVVLDSYGLPAFGRLQLPLTTLFDAGPGAVFDLLAAALASYERTTLTGALNYLCGQPRDHCLNDQIADWTDRYDWFARVQQAAILSKVSDLPEIRSVLRSFAVGDSAFGVPVIASAALRCSRAVSGALVDIVMGAGLPDSLDNRATFLIDEGLAADAEKPALPLDTSELQVAGCLWLAREADANAEYSDDHVAVTRSLTTPLRVVMFRQAAHRLAWMFELEKRANTP